MAYTLEITEYTLQALVHSGVIPHTYVQASAGQDRLLRFDRDKQGQKRLLAKAREVFKILDKTLLKKPLDKTSGGGLYLTIRKVNLAQSGEHL
jgi:hypothetical protein